MIDHDIVIALIARAEEVKLNSYSPYSGFKVGAAVLSTGDLIFTGTNVENASYGLTVCAERVAIGCMIAAGCEEIAAIAIAADRPYTPPCGACRQVIYELGPEASVILTGKGKPRIIPISSLIPTEFSLDE
jgi:cytidine deaminase